MVSNRLYGVPMGYVADLYVGGLRLVAKQPLGIGGCYDMILQVTGSGERVCDVGVVVICQWVRKDSRRDSFEIGFALDRPSPSFVDLVGELLPKRR